MTRVFIILIVLALNIFYGCGPSKNLLESDVSRDKKSEGFATHTIKGKKVNPNNESDFNRLLSGKVPGLQINDTSSSMFDSTEIRIRGEIVDHLRRNSNLCRTTIQMQQKYNASFEKLSRQLQREPKNSEIATDMGLEASELDNWEQAFAANTHQSLDSVYDEFSIWFASNDQSPEDELSDTELRENLVEALKTLPEREAMLIQLYYVEELNVYEIAEVLEITTGRVSQIKKSAISRLREFIQKID